MPTDFDVVILTLCAMVLFGAGWVCRGVVDALVAMAEGLTDYMRQRAQERAK